MVNSLNKKMLLTLLVLSSIGIFAAGAGRLMRELVTEIDEYLPVSRTLLKIHKDFKRSMLDSIDAQNAEQVTTYIRTSTNTVVDSSGELVQKSMSQEIFFESISVSPGAVKTLKPEPEPEPEVRLFVKSNAPNIKVRVLNIRPKFQQGMFLREGDYELEVSSEGYRTTTQWINAKADVLENGSIEKAKDYAVDITLSPIMTKDYCSKNISIYSQPFDNGLASGGLITSTILLPNASVPDVYRSSAESLRSLNYARLIRTSLSNSYGEVVFEVPPLTQDDINKNIEFGMQELHKYYNDKLPESIPIITSFEKVGGDVKLVSQTIVPLGLESVILDKAVWCENNSGF